MEDSTPQKPSPPPQPGSTGPQPPQSSQPPQSPPPVKPPPPKPPVMKGPASPARRKFISWLAVAWTAFAAATTGALSLVGRYMFPNVLFEPKDTFKVGFPDDFEVGNVDTRFKEKFAVWIVRSVDGIYALSTVCTHLGCTPSWLSGENKFKCPCHGSGFFKSGINFEGPAPRPLERFRIVLAEDGQILVDKSKKFQQERGEWNQPESIVVV